MRAEIVVGQLLRKTGKTLAVAESVTGGLIQHRITEIPGSSDYFLGGVVAYSNALKESLLGVPSALLVTHGAVSAPVAAAMAKGVRRLAGSDLGLAVTGIAGPTTSYPVPGTQKVPGTEKKPVGLTFIALAHPRGAAVRRFLFSGPRSPFPGGQSGAGPRSMVKWKASQAALDAVRNYVIATASVSEAGSNLALKTRLLRRSAPRKRLLRPSASQEIATARWVSREIATARQRSLAGLAMTEVAK